MPDPTIRITLERVLYTVFGRAEGSGQGTISAAIVVGTQRTAIGDATRVFNYRANRLAQLGWTVNFNVRNVEWMELSVLCQDQTGRRIAGFTYRMSTPWRMFENEILSTRNAHLIWSVRPGTWTAPVAGPPPGIRTSREHNGSVTYTTVSGRRNEFRLEICPVRPVPPDLQLPRRPLHIDFSSLAGWSPPVRNGAGREIQASDPLNVIANPPVIPRLAAPPNPPPNPPPAPEELDNAATANHRNSARIEFTYYWPSSERFADKDRRLEWRKIGGAGDVAFIKYRPSDPDGSENRGLKVMVYGTTDGEVVLGVHFNNTVVAKYRAVVSAPKRVPCRFNILNGPAGPVGDPLRFTPPTTPAQCEAHREIANRFLRQVGFTLVPDANVNLGTAPAGRTITRTDRAGIFRIRVPGGDTRGVSDNDAQRLLAYNYRRRVMNFVYVRSHADGVLGAAIYWPNSKLAPATTTNDNGTPSSSWIQPSGVSPDANAGTVTIKLTQGWPPPGGRPELYGMLVTGDTGPAPGGEDAVIYGATIAHEVGHMLNLGHRVEEITNAGLNTSWNDGSLVAGPAGRIAQLIEGAGNLGANDGLWCDELWFPRHENIMHWNEDSYFAQNLDLLQAKIVQQSPLLDLA